MTSIINSLVHCHRNSVTVIFNLVGSLNTARLAIEQRGSDQTHFEIVPVLAECNGTTKMTQPTHETLLKGVTLTAQ